MQGEEFSHCILHRAQGGSPFLVSHNDPLTAAPQLPFPPHTGTPESCHKQHKAGGRGSRPGRGCSQTTIISMSAVIQVEKRKNLASHWKCTCQSSLAPGPGFAAWLRGLTSWVVICLPWSQAASLLGSWSPWPLATHSPSGNSAGWQLLVAMCT